MDAERKQEGNSSLDFPGTERSPKWIRNILWGIYWSLSVTVIYCAFAVVLYALRGSAPFSANSTTVLAVLGSYLAAGLFVGILLGTLRPILKNVLGAIVVGWLCAFVVFLAVQLAVDGFRLWEPRDLRGAGFLALLFGPVGALVFRHYGRRLSDEG